MVCKLTISRSFFDNACIFVLYTSTATRRWPLCGVVHLGLSLSHARGVRRLCVNPYVLVAQ